MRKPHIAIVFFVLIAVLLSTAQSQTIPYQPGRYSWKIHGGEIQLFAARYTNRNSFDNRAYTFYYETTDKKQIYIVPIKGAKPGDTTFTTVSTAGGDWLFSDITVQRKSATLELIKVRQDTPGAWDEPGDLIVERYFLKKGDEEDVPYQFILQSKTVNPVIPRVSVDEVLEKSLRMQFGD